MSGQNKCNAPSQIDRQMTGLSAQARLWRAAAAECHQNAELSSYPRRQIKDVRDLESLRTYRALGRAALSTRKLWATKFTKCVMLNGLIRRVVMRRFRGWHCLVAVSTTLLKWRSRKRAGCGSPAGNS
jgi:hypothetical protein